MPGLTGRLPGQRALHQRVGGQGAGGELFNTAGSRDIKQRLAACRVDFLHHSQLQGLSVCRNTQHLAGVNLVWVRQHRLVGFKNLRVFVGRAVKLFADF